ncbi:hypothetical protein RB595_001437 [Gaeumannomyces hyphopodioides]
MGKLRYNVAASLDGFIARPDGSYDWIPPDDSIDFAALYAQFDAFIMGRKTYETMLAQGDENPLKDRPRDRVAVVTGTGLAGGSARDVTVLAGTAEAVAWVAEAGRRFGRDVWLFGGGALAASLLDEGVVDTVEVAIIPVVLGRGIRVISGDLASSRRLRLTGSEILASGIAMCKYEVIYESSGGGCQTAAPLE